MSMQIVLEYRVYVHDLIGKSVREAVRESCGISAAIPCNLNLTRLVLVVIDLIIMWLHWEYGIVRLEAQEYNTHITSAGKDP